MQSNKDLNVSFFGNNQQYQNVVNQFDSYRFIAQEISKQIGSAKTILDMGNGGFINYAIPPSTRLIRAIDICIKRQFKKKVGKTEIIFQNGDVLSYQDANKYDLVLMQNFLHHVVGETTTENYRNLEICLGKTIRLLKKNGRLVIMESVVPRWLETIEKFTYPLTKGIIPIIFHHPATFQYSQQTIVSALSTYQGRLHTQLIKRGKFFLIYGKKIPTFLAPVQVASFTVENPRH